MSARTPRRAPEVISALPVAVDAMGGDRAPQEIVKGARLAADEGIEVVLVGPPEQVGDTCGLELVACSEVIAMDEDPGQGVRRKKDSSLVRAAEMVRDGRACAMVSAGNTGAAMASALLRMGRLPGVHRPCIATPLPRLGQVPAVLVDAGANAECTPAMLLQFALMGAAYAATRYDVAEPSVALLSIGEESSKGTPLVKETHKLLASTGLGRGGPGSFRFVGNIEGRDLLPSPADVVVTDGFTGNVTLKTLEGSLRFLFETLLGVFETDDATRGASKELLPHLMPIASQLDPEGTGGAMLLGVDGVCVISHGSSSSVAILNAVRVAAELVRGGLVDQLAEAVSPPGGDPGGTPTRDRGKLLDGDPGPAGDTGPVSSVGTPTTTGVPTPRP
ncbi:MAG: phosphate acyltransferase PlsX [Actinomycetota bacterium]|nr:phosphate acyltransferase PlsX [Actinomycetota bacterium]